MRNILLDNPLIAPSELIHYWAKKHADNLRVPVDYIESAIRDGTIEVWATYVDGKIVGVSLCAVDGDNYVLRESFDMSANDVVDILIEDLRAHCILHGYKKLQVATLRRNMINKLRRIGFVPQITLLSMEV